MSYIKDIMAKPPIKRLAQEAQVASEVARYAAGQRVIHTTSAGLAGLGIGAIAGALAVVDHPGEPNDMVSKGWSA